MTEEPKTTAKSKQTKQKTARSKRENQTTGEDMGVTIEKMLGNILTETVKESELLTQGIKNLNDIPDFYSEELKPVDGRESTPGIIGFSKNFKLAIACGKAQVRYLEMGQFVSIIENARALGSASSIMLQNFKDQGQDHKNSGAKGQVLARLNIKSSAIHVMQGLTGKVIRNPSDIALLDVYFINRVDLLSFYLSARINLANDDELATMIYANDGWKAMSVPISPMTDPYGGDE